MGSLVAIAVALVLVAACGGKSKSAAAVPMGQELYTLSCAACHGTTGAGNTFTLKGQTIKVHALGWADLSQAYATDPSRGSVEQQIGLAITKGLDEKGEALNQMMPRWSTLSSAQVDSIIAYIKANFK